MLEAVDLWMLTPNPPRGAMVLPKTPPKFTPRSGLPLRYATNLGAHFDVVFSMQKVVIRPFLNAYSPNLGSQLLEGLTVLRTPRYPPSKSCEQDSGCRRSDVAVLQVSACFRLPVSVCRSQIRGVAKR